MIDSSRARSASQLNGLELNDLASVVQSTPAQRNPDAVSFALDLVKIIGGAWRVPAGPGRSRRDADDRRPGAGPWQTMQTGLVIVPMQNELSAMTRDDAFECRRVFEPAQPPGAADMRRVVKANDARKSLRLRAFQQIRERRQLSRPEPPGSDERRRRHAGVETDQRDAAAPAQIGKARRRRSRSSSKARKPRERDPSRSPHKRRDFRA